LPKPLFTPSTKAAIGDHDENIHPDKVNELLGERLAAEVEQKALALYTQASQHALERGIIIADTKFEFGVDDNGVLHLVDEVLTPDSSRFWPASKYEPGRNQESFDKQVVRDYLTSIQFNKKDPITLPPEVIQKTLDKYKEVYTMLTGKQIQ
jgi:phosphoribosylaminoimidazole-succinocarboxamide synthase